MNTGEVLDVVGLLEEQLAYATLEIAAGRTPRRFRLWQISKRHGLGPYSGDPLVKFVDAHVRRLVGS